ncbi:hypothetical protein RAS1_22230 [Phycisphaerae bacterium RAS1]|nr:hypothetical protein RAS1_22230 [Phycisphaerae bacterium RAS1]
MRLHIFRPVDIRALVCTLVALGTANAGLASPLLFADGPRAAVAAWPPVSSAAFSFMLQDSSRPDKPAATDENAGGQVAGGICQPDATGMACTTFCPVPPGGNCVPVEITVYPDGTWHVTKCECLSGPDGCYIAYDPVAGPICQGVCPDGVSNCEVFCRRNIDNSVTYRCGCPDLTAPTCDVVSICNPDMPGTCRPGCGGLCPAGECCTPTVIKKLPTVPPTYEVVACECLGENECHPILDINVVVCVGACPDGSPCETLELFDPATGIYYYHCECNPIQMGACCYEIQPGSIQCVITTPTDCAAVYNGIYMGNGVPCTPNPCNIDGACCVGVCPTTGCIVTLYADCVMQGGIWQGIGTNCLPPSHCDVPVGACCHIGPTGPTCSIVSAPCCNTVLNGSYQGDGTTCATAPCNMDGACCILVGGVSQCIQTTQTGCLAQGGSYKGDGTVCNPDSCCNRPTVLYVNDNNTGNVYQVFPDTSTISFWKNVPGAFNLAAGASAGNIYVSNQLSQLFAVNIGSTNLLGLAPPHLALGEGRDGWLYSGVGATIARVHPGTAASTFIGGGPEPWAGDVATEPWTGTLYGATNSGRLVRVNKTTGAQTIIGTHGKTFWGIGFALDGRLFACCTDGFIYRINTVNGMVTPIFNIGFAGGDMASQPWEPCGPCAKPPLSMVGWWPFDETTVPPTIIPTARDIALPAQNGQHQNGPTPAAGVVNVSLEFDGVDDYVKVNNNAQLNFPANQDFSIDAWIRTNGQGIQSIVDKRVVGGGGAIGYSMFLFNGTLSFQIGDTVGFSNWISTLAANDGRWHHVAATVQRTSATGLKLYVDGVSQSFNPSARAGNTTNTAELWIGQRQPISSIIPYVGRIDELQIFRRALTPAEVQAIYLAGGSGKCRQSCQIPNITFCKNQIVKPATMTICNYSPAPQTYFWNLAGPLTGPGCTALGSMTFTPSSGFITVPAGSCSNINVLVGRPTGLPNPPPYLNACYAMNVINLANGLSFTCNGNINATNQWCFAICCPGNDGSGTLIPLRAGGNAARTVGFDVTTETTMLSYRIETHWPDGSPAPQIVSLNGLPPGIPVKGDLGPTPLHVDVEVQALDHEPFATTVLSVLGDDDDDPGTPFQLMEEIVLMTLPNAVGDMNCDGEVNILDINPFVLALSSATDYQAAYPECARELADVNDDGNVDILDINPFVQLLSGT